jgi:hypothetical protein
VYAVKRAQLTGAMSRVEEFARLDSLFYIQRTPADRRVVMKFLCLAYEEQKTLDDLSRDEWQALRAETLAYVEVLRNSGHLILTHALQSASTAETVRVRDRAQRVVDGPYAETKEQLGGFFLIEARDMRQAVELASRWPSARIGSIEVRPIEEELKEERRY